MFREPIRVGVWGVFLINIYIWSRLIRRDPVLPPRDNIIQVMYKKQNKTKNNENEDETRQPTVNNNNNIFLQVLDSS